MTESGKSGNVLPLETSVPAGAVPPESILCTEELQRRPSRPPDYEKENRALNGAGEYPGRLAEEAIMNGFTPRAKAGRVHGWRRAFAISRHLLGSFASRAELVAAPSKV